MTSSIKELQSDKLSTKFEITIAPEAVTKAIDQKLAEIAKTVKMDGFRPGKVPLSVVRKRYAESVRGEAMENAINTAVRGLINDKKLKPAMQPEINVEKFDDDNVLVFTMDVTHMPDIKLPDLAKLSVEKPVSPVTDDEINQALERIAGANKSTEAMKTKREIKDGDIARISYDGSVDGERKPGMQSDEHDLEIGSGSFIPGFEEQVIGMKPGDSKAITVTFPEDYFSKDIAGKEAKFEVEVKELRKTVEAKIDDDLAKSLGMESLDKLKEAISQQVQREHDQMSNMRLRRNLLDALDDAVKFDVPARMVELEQKMIWQEHLRDLQQRGLDTAEAEADESTKAEFNEIAERRVRLGLVMSQVGEQEGVNVSAQDLDRRITLEAYSYPGQEQQVIEYYQKNPRAVEALRAPIFEDKVVKLLTEKVQIKDIKVDLETLTADPDEEAEADRAKKAKKPAAKKKTAKKKSA